MNIIVDNLWISCGQPVDNLWKNGFFRVYTGHPSPKIFEGREDFVRLTGGGYGGMVLGMKKQELRKVIEGVLESESQRFENFKVMPEGQKKLVNRKLVEAMVEKLAKDFFKVPDVYARLQIMKFFADYSGQKPADVKVLEVNPYDGMTSEELEVEEKRLLSYDEE